MASVNDVVEAVKQGIPKYHKGFRRPEMLDENTFTLMYGVSTYAVAKHLDETPTSVRATLMEAESKGLLVRSRYTRGFPTLWTPKGYIKNLNLIEDE